MRYLHPVATSETFMARGVYRCYQGETRLSDYQAWTRHAVAGGGVLTRIDQERRGMITLAEVLETDSGQFERLHVREWNSASQAAYRTLRADYIFFRDYVQISRQVNDDATVYAEIYFPPETTLIDMPFNVFKGVFLKRLMNNLDTAFSSLRPTWWLDKEGSVTRSESVPRPHIGLADSHGLTPRYTKMPTLIYDTDREGVIVMDDHNIPLQQQSTDHIILLTEYAHS
jgi:hypothetical protein